MRPAQAIGHFKNAENLPGLVDIALPDKVRAQRRARTVGGIDDERTTGILDIF